MKKPTLDHDRDRDDHDRNRDRDDHDHDRDYDRDRNDRNPAAANDNGKRAHETGAIAPALTGDALTSLQALATALCNVDTASVAGRSGLPMLQFKREGSGIWMFGQKKTVVEEGSQWAVNPLTFKRGYICFSAANKILGERLVPVSLPMPEVTELPTRDLRGRRSGQST
jgi:hypothetical protein